MATREREREADVYREWAHSAGNNERRKIRRAFRRTPFRKIKLRRYIFDQNRKWHKLQISSTQEQPARDKY